MRIRRLHIAGFRCIDDLTLDFTGPDGAPCQFVAIIGPNGTGKTSILEAIANALAGAANRPPGPLPETMELTFETRQVLNVAGHELRGPVSAFGRVAHHTLFAPASRDPLVSGQPITQGTPSALDPHQALHGGSTGARAKAVHAWITHQQISRERTTLWDAVSAFLPHYEFVGLTPELELQFSVRQKRVLFRDLSSGERKIIFLFAEILMHCGPNGILLIDEPEAHLHPDWQRRMPGALQALLPEGQIIAATHSPYIIDGLEPHQVFELVPDGGEPW
ncbi:MAG: AAA family ATPase [Alphaproteobacteria bacterium]|nr:AAA family ATPase [Alphaproteobacteria bacterium]